MVGIIVQPTYLIGNLLLSNLCHLPTLGLIEVMPQKAAGILKLPPKSLPKPNTEPWAAIRAASPPEDPPDVLDRS